MHFDQNILFIVIVAIIGIFRLVARIAENASDQSRHKKTSSGPSQSPQSHPRISISTTKSDEERVREFLEALGQAPGTKPPPRVTPRTDVPPRPMAPISPPPLSRPFSPVPSKRSREKVRRILPSSQPVSSAPARATSQTNEPGAWIAEEQRIETAAARFQTASGGAYDTAQGIRPPADATWKQMLRSADAVRSAIVLREIFGPPRGLQPLELPF